MKSLGYLGAFFGGAIAGAVIGLLLAPEKGEDTRSKISDTVEDFIKNNGIEIAVLTIPKDQAVPMAHKLAECGIKAIWNFAHVDLDVPNNIQVENVHLSDSLMKLSYNISRYEKTL